uniref:Phosphoglycerate mutase family protein n=1 Tax=Pseudo-nitzschia australis TaxID=44445 RepID=A0A7S4AQW6_9STRA|mmetsp:Transcript_25043/g.54906  ORF Transcript_25043/g.54906 Transcript_25043/m.54906 type:complete len:490 (-) Transcript_25043:275-1744(-)|eukprot:CAMPEP_0168194840 /NCGR_PEP_ID=MMETSP0139_2-20121125/19469_1 /TAXON_ID=44445 /ORGANISM="Pseudo-nitzschia australis, Strain 10249 10 AB" /LENGTH=489 /DNA_ID=CAMNT_0008118519 /DNA_START=190 /DNA_END=1659 /DNA_ORIENTATION=+
MSRRIELYILRHGEREDEAIKKEFYSRRAHRSVEREPTTDSRDPMLTGRGHCQAYESFARLTDTLLFDDGGGPRKIAVFSSPLRRVVGTALMIGTVSTQSKNKIMLEFPSISEKNRSGTNGDAIGSIPVTILNDLGNSAANIFKYGGVQELVPKGFLRCASMDANDGTDASPFVRAVTSMPVNQLMEYDKIKNCKPVQFWKRRQDEAGSWLYSPMSKPVNPVSQNKWQGGDGFCYPSTSIRKNHVLLLSKNPLLAIDEAVVATADRGCNVCIVVAHRETIRDLAAEKCNYFGSLPTPYCCIGSFAASIAAGVTDDDDIQGAATVKYHFHNVWSTEAFGTLAIPRYFPHIGGSSRMGSSSSSSSVMLLAPGYSAPHCICTIRSALQEGQLGSQVWLSDARKFKASKDVRKRHKSKSFRLEMEILSGHKEWELFWTGLGAGTMKGWASWELPNGGVNILEVETNASVNKGRQKSSGTIDMTVRAMLSNDTL